ncbi:hypothetical protein [Culicoidibacter larvae]|uniref:Uncharacterized protein n=1 Tax=Culicoidibacter larvae TaxID=2579976 RepID=A0A5R8Q6H6_9FIRM|nr:hypothetical protein [Culicoidibacter larvae]TLG70260.1 hypothetical protein FEZ08_11980 [Culicoidibacter larvae]
MSDIENTNKQRPGFTRQNRTERSVSIEPTQVASDQRSFPDEPIIQRETPKEKQIIRRKTTSKSNDLPKSIRISLADHVAISTISMVEDIKIYEVISNMVDLYVETLSPPQQKLVKNAVTATKDIK